MTKKHKRNPAWLKEHFTDPYVQRAQREGWRSRAVFKLQEMDRRDKLIRPGQCIVDLGAAPGGWSQYAARQLDGRGEVFALDILPMQALPGVQFLQADFSEVEALDQLRAAMNGRGADLVMSDMAPNISGMAEVDLPRHLHLAEMALEAAQSLLKPGGLFLIKMFSGVGVDGYLRTLRSAFRRVDIRKPDASRSRSRELYLLARDPKNAEPDA
jgi:23S rRNA (uridine2552-2'-O)-methyltransferase